MKRKRKERRKPKINGVNSTLGVRLTLDKMFTESIGINLDTKLSDKKQGEMKKKKQEIVKQHKLL